MWGETLNAADNKVENKDKVNERAWDLSPELRQKVADTDKNVSKINDVVEKEKKTNENNIKPVDVVGQQTGVAEKIHPKKADKIRLYIDTYTKNPKFGKVITGYTIDWGANGEFFDAAWNDKKDLEETLAEVTTSLKSKNYNWENFAKSKWLVIPPTIWNWVWSLDDQLNALSSPQAKSDLLNTWLSVARAFQMLDVFDAEQMKVVLPKLTMSANFYKGKPSSELKYAKFEAMVDPNQLEKYPLPWEVRFKFSEISSVQSWTEGGDYNPNSLKADTYSLWSISNRKLVDQKTNVPVSSINRSNSSGGVKEPDPRTGNWIWATALQELIGKSFINWPIPSWTLVKDVYSHLNNFNVFGVNGNERTQNSWPLYEINILANKIDPNHWLNDYFDIKREKDPVSWRENISSITMKNTLKSSNLGKDYLTSLEILDRIYKEQNISDPKFTDFFEKTKAEDIQNKKDLNQMLATGFVKLK